MALRIDPAAAAEVQDAAIWYERQEPGLAWKFLSIYESALEAIERNPESFPLLEALNSPEVRYCLLKPYAYRIGFRVKGDEVVVFSVGHVRRGSQFWQLRMKPPAG